MVILTAMVTAMVTAGSSLTTGDKYEMKHLYWPRLLPGHIPVNPKCGGHGDGYDYGRGYGVGYGDGYGGGYGYSDGHGHGDGENYGNGVGEGSGNGVGRFVTTIGR